MPPDLTMRVRRSICPAVDLVGWAASMTTRGLSPTTIRRRMVSIGMLVRYVAPAPLADVTADDVEEWLGQWECAATRSAYLKDVRAWARWAMRKDLIGADPVAELESIQVERTLPNPISDVDLHRAIAAASSPVAVALTISGWAGLRCAEVAALAWHDVHLDRSPMTLDVRHGKWAKDRTVPLHPRLEESFAGLVRRDGLVVGCDAVALSQRVRKLFDQLGIDGGIHRCRHRFGTEAYRASRDLLAVARLMGHASTTPTMGYVALSGAMLADAVLAMA